MTKDELFIANGHEPIKKITPYYKERIKPKTSMRNEYKCGCSIYFDGVGYFINWCNLHKNASKLLNACKDALDFVSTGHLDNEEMFKILEQAIKQAEEVS